MAGLSAMSDRDTSEEVASTTTIAAVTATAMGGSGAGIAGAGVATGSAVTASASIGVTSSAATSAVENQLGSLRISSRSLTTATRRRVVSVVEQPLVRAGAGREVNEAVYALLFSELVQYCRNRVVSVTDLETKLADVGKRVGRRALDLVVIREKILRRETRIIGILNFVVTSLWKALFGKQADGLKKFTDAKFYIEEQDPMVNKYISVPKDYGRLNCAAFVGGIIDGALEAAGFPSKVTVDYIDSSARPVTIYVIEFGDSVVARERKLTQ